MYSLIRSSVLLPNKLGSCTCGVSETVVGAEAAAGTRQLGSAARRGPFSEMGSEQVNTSKIKKRINKTQNKNVRVGQRPPNLSTSRDRNSCLARRGISVGGYPVFPGLGCRLQYRVTRLPSAGTCRPHSQGRGGGAHGGPCRRVSYTSAGNRAQHSCPGAIAKGTVPWPHLAARKWGGVVAWVPGRRSVTKGTKEKNKVW